MGQRLKGGLMVGGIVVALVVAMLALYQGIGESPKLGSVQQGSEYHSTSTHSGTQKQIILTTTTGDIYQSYNGTLGSLILTGVGNSEISFYDATTTIASQRAASLVTSTIHLGTIGANVAANTYTFDTNYRYGLIAVYSNTADIPSSTITWR